MHQIHVARWENFEEQLSNLQELHGGALKHGKGHISPFLYRGQSDSEWGLATTLERSDVGDTSLSEYYRLMCAVKPQLESVTDKHWHAPDPIEYDDWLSGRTHTAVAPPGYEYMVYLRHHGFPSPLLDWTRSPYIAAFFAFRHAHRAAKNVAVFVYREYLGGGKSWESGRAHIHGMGPYIRTHPRHFLQQSEYTICIVRDTEWRYARHEDAFARGEPGQDALWQLCLPSTERRKALQFLDQMNLNAYSLFGTEDTLVETLALRELRSNSHESGPYTRAIDDDV